MRLHPKPRSSGRKRGRTLAYDWSLGDEAAVGAALKQAAHVTQLKLINNRIVVNAMEPRARRWAFMTRRAITTRSTARARASTPCATLSRQFSLNIPVEKLRVVTEDVGGGFGMKTFVYPEYPLVLFAAKKLGRPVKWTGDRSVCLPHGQSGPRPCYGSIARARQGRTYPRHSGRYHRQSRRLPEPVRAVHSFARPAQHASGRL